MSKYFSINELENNDNMNEPNEVWSLWIEKRGLVKSIKCRKHVKSGTGCNISRVDAWFREFKQRNGTKFAIGIVIAVKDKI